MFSNPGAKIKVFAKVLFWVISILCIVISIEFGWEEETHYGIYHSYTSREFKPEIFFPFFFGGPIGAYLQSLIMCAFADVVEDVKATREALCGGGNPQILGQEDARRMAAREAEAERIKAEAARIQAEKERKEAEEREAALAAEKQRERNKQYWNQHKEEKEALCAKKKEAEEKLGKISTLAPEERKAIQNLIQAIDEELTKNR